MEAGDVIDLVFPPPEPYDVTPEEIPLNIIFEDDYVIGLNKQPGIIMHPACKTQGWARSPTPWPSTQAASRTATTRSAPASFIASTKTRQAS